MSIHFNLIGGSSVSDHGKFVYENYINGLPLVDDDDFIDRINDVIDKYKIDFIFPAHDSVVLKLSQEYEKGVLKCKVVTSCAKTCDISRSKKKTYEVLDGIVATPKIYNKPVDIQDVDLPVFLKPDVGQGSKGTYKAKTTDEIDFYLQRDPTLLLLEYLPGREYTVDCFTDTDGNLLFCEGRERKRVSGGISVNSETVKDGRFSELAKKINNKILFRGVWFFQVKEDNNGNLVLMEIAPRIAGTMGLVRCKGVNLALMSLFDMLGYKVSVLENSYDMIIDRALQSKYSHNINYDQVYLDFDDTVMVEGKMNLSVITFIFQCINNGIKVSLLTRHSGELNEILKKNRLENVFDEIFWVRDGSSKSSYIKNRNSIFIDDSFKERKEVCDLIKIPVFDTHMIECLIK